MQINNPEAIANCEASGQFPINDSVREGFALTEGGEEDQWESLTLLALHEQYNVLGKVIYQDEDFRDQLDANERFGELPYTTPATAILSSSCHEERVDRRNVFSDSTPFFGRDHLWGDEQRLNWIAGIDEEGNETDFGGHIADQWRGIYIPRVLDGYDLVFGPFGPECIPRYRDGEPMTERERREIIGRILNNP